jgi:hypothetical protein
VIRSRRLLLYVLFGLLAIQPASARSDAPLGSEEYATSFAWLVGGVLSEAALCRAPVATFKETIERARTVLTELYPKAGLNPQDIERDIEAGWYSDELTSELPPQNCSSFRRQVSNIAAWTAEAMGQPIPQLAPYDPACWPQKDC